MGLFDKIKDEAEKLTHRHQGAEQSGQASQDAGQDPGNPSADMDAAKDMIREQGSGDHDMNMDASSGNTTEQNQGQ
jgi:hypothetical protein